MICADQPLRLPSHIQGGEYEGIAVITSPSPPPPGISYKIQNLYLPEPFVDCVNQNCYSSHAVMNHFFQVILTATGPQHTTGYYSAVSAASELLLLWSVSVTISFLSAD